MSKQKNEYVLETDKGRYIAATRTKVVTELIFSPFSTGDDDADEPMELGDFDSVEQATSAAQKHAGIVPVPPRRRTLVMGRLV